MYKSLDSFSPKQLKECASKIKIPTRNVDTKDLIKNIKSAFELYEKFKANKYEKLEQIGNKGKEGITYLVKDTATGKKYAMKVFKKTKSSAKIEEEVNLQELAAKAGVAPKVHDYDKDEKYIVMDIMDKHLFDGTVLSLDHQRQIINIFSKLDKAKVFHGDANILNYMVKKDKVFMIDYGWSKHITTELKNKLKSEHPNMEIMLLGLILKMKELKMSPQNYSYLKTKLSPETIITYKI